MPPETAIREPTIPELLRCYSATFGFSDAIGRIERHLAWIEEKLSKQRDASADGWLDASKAAKYLDMAQNTFDKFRYEQDLKPKGYKVGGRTLYKREDLDHFVKLWEVKSNGLA